MLERTYCLDFLSQRFEFVYWFYCKVIPIRVISFRGEHGRESASRPHIRDNARVSIGGCDVIRAMEKHSI